MLTFFKKIFEYFCPRKKPTQQVPQFLIDACRYAQTICLMGRCNVPEFYDKSGGWFHTVRKRSLGKCLYVKDPVTKTWTLKLKGRAVASIPYEIEQFKFYTSPNFLIHANFAQVTRIGNCETLASCAADFIWQHHSNKINQIQVWTLTEADHVFLMVEDRDERRWIVDPFVGEGLVYLEEDYELMMRDTIITYYQGLKALNDQGKKYKLLNDPASVSLEAKIKNLVLGTKPYPAGFHDAIHINDYTMDIRDQMYQFKKQRKAVTKKFKEECMAELCEHFEKKLKIC